MSVVSFANSVIICVKIHEVYAILPIFLRNLMGISGGELGVGVKVFLGASGVWKIDEIPKHVSVPFL